MCGLFLYALAYPWRMLVVFTPLGSLPFSFLRLLFSPSAPLLVTSAALSCFAVLLLVCGLLLLPSVPHCRCLLISLGHRVWFPSIALVALQPLGLASLPWSWSFLSRWSLSFFCLGFLRSFTLAPRHRVLVVPLRIYQVHLWRFNLRPWVFPPLSLALRSSLSARFSCSFFARASSALCSPSSLGVSLSLSPLLPSLAISLGACGVYCMLFFYTPSPSACRLCFVAWAPLPLPCSPCPSWAPCALLFYCLPSSGT